MFRFRQVSKLPELPDRGGRHRRLGGLFSRLGLPFSMLRQERPICYNFRPRPPLSNLVGFKEDGNMRRRLVGTMLVAAGVVFGFTLDRYGRMETTQAATRAEAADDEREDVAAQLKEIKTQVKDINTLLQSGKLRVVVVINAEQQ